MKVNSVLEYSGARLTIRYCEQPQNGDDPRVWLPPSLHEALAGIPAKKHANVLAQLAARREILANRGQLRSPDNWNTEGELPNGKRFYAIKAGDLRSYGWFSDKHKGVFYISHFAFKQGQKLSKKNARRVEKNWRRIEGQLP